MRIVATFGVFTFVGSFLFLSGWFVFAPDRPGLGRRRLIDWSCPRCDLWSTAYTSRFWRPRARRRALGLLHRRLSPTCPATDDELLVLS